MRKEKSKKSAVSKVDFPAGVWTVRFTLENTNDPLVLMGWLDLAGLGTQGNTMKFDDDPHFGEIRDTTFTVNVTYFNADDGTIHYHIPGAAELFNPSTPIAFRFYFTGIYAYDEGTKKMELNGNGKAPYGFYPQLGQPGADGDNVTWTSAGQGDQRRKHSR